MARARKKARRFSSVKLALLALFCILVVSMLSAYISNQVIISAKRAELEALNAQIAQQQADNEEMQRILSGDPDEVSEWIARDSYGYAAPNERIFVDVSGN